MSKVIIFTNHLDGVSVVTPSDEVTVEEIFSKVVPKESEGFIVDSESLPWIDNDFFGAWEQSNGKVTVNLNKAKEITKERLRKEREPLLSKLDVDFQRALESGANTSEIVAEKQKLRDLPNFADSCITLFQLRNLKAD